MEQYSFTLQANGFRMEDNDNVQITIHVLCTPDMETKPTETSHRVRVNAKNFCSFHSQMQQLNYPQSKHSVRHPHYEQFQVEYESVDALNPRSSVLCKSVKMTIHKRKYIHNHKRNLPKISQKHLWYQHFAIGQISDLCFSSFCRGSITVMDPVNTKYIYIMECADREIYTTI